MSIRCYANVNLSCCRYDYFSRPPSGCLYHSEPESSVLVQGHSFNSQCPVSHPSLPCPSVSQHGAKESVQLSPCPYLARTLHFIGSELRLETPWQKPRQHRLVCSTASRLKKAAHHTGRQGTISSSGSDCWHMPCGLLELSGASILCNWLGSHPEPGD